MQISQLFFARIFEKIFFLSRKDEAFAPSFSEISFKLII